MDDALDTPPWPRGVYLGIVASVGVTASIAAWISLGSLAAVGLALAAAGAAAGWWRAGPADPRVAVVPTVGLTVALMAATTEAWALDLPGFAAAAVDGRLTERGLLVAAYALFSACTFGAWAAWYRHPLGGYAAWLTATIAVASPVALGVLAAVTASYAPGLGTSLVAGAAGLAAARSYMGEAGV